MEIINLKSQYDLMISDLNGQQEVKLAAVGTELVEAKRELEEAKKRIVELSIVVPSANQPPLPIHSEPEQVLLLSGQIAELQSLISFKQVQFEKQISEVLAAHSARDDALAQLAATKSECDKQKAEINRLEAKLMSGGLEFANV